jgi:isocitrate dehydrogenase
MDVVIIRENEEDLYAGIEHQQTDEVVQCLKLISRPGTEKIIRYAFEYARCYGRKKVTCFSKDNIMKMTDGLFHKMFEEIGAEYPDLEQEHLIVDIGAARLADTPEAFDVIVMPNLYGDILSDVAAQISGSVGIGGSANIGTGYAMFEAIHGSAPNIAGKNIANPSGLLLAALQMLVYIGQSDVATRIQNAWLCTLEDGIHTKDIYNPQLTISTVGTGEFAAALIDRLGHVPQQLKPVNYQSALGSIKVELKQREAFVRQLVGVDVFVFEQDRDPENLAGKIKDLSVDGLSLTMITNRGTKVWPEGFPETFCTDHWRCRFKSSNDDSIEFESVIKLLKMIDDRGVKVIKTENLYLLDGKQAFSAGQGQ